MTQIFWKIGDLRVGDIFLLRKSKFMITGLTRESMGFDVSPGDLVAALPPTSAYVIELGTGLSFSFPANLEVQPVEIIVKAIK